MKAMGNIEFTLIPRSVQILIIASVFVPRADLKLPWGSEPQYR